MASADLEHEKQWLQSKDPRIMATLTRLFPHMDSTRQCMLLHGALARWQVEQGLSLSFDFRNTQDIDIWEHQAEYTIDSTEFVAVLCSLRERLAAALTPIEGEQLSATDNGTSYRHDIAAKICAMKQGVALLISGMMHPCLLNIQQSVTKAYEKAFADALRDIFGNPFRRTPAIDPAWLAWNDCVVPKLAKGIYEDRAFDRMRILGDALEEAGCAIRVILDHCRTVRRHVRGCWVLDGILGKR